MNYPKICIHVINTENVCREELNHCLSFYVTCFCCHLVSSSRSLCLDRLIPPQMRAFFLEAPTSSLCALSEAMDGLHQPPGVPSMMPNITCPSERVFAAGTAFLLMTAASECAMILFLISGFRLSIASEVQPWSPLGRLTSSGSVNLRLRRASLGVIFHSFRYARPLVCDRMVSVR